MQQNKEDIFLQIFRETLKHNISSKLETSELTKINLKGTNSQIIKENNSLIYCAKFKNLEGLFVKEKPKTRRFGRYLCDLVKVTFNCHGFFTSDELPRYGLSRPYIKKIFEKMNKKEGDGNLLIIYAYNFETSNTINQFLINYLQEKISQL